MRRHEPRSWTLAVGVALALGAAGCASAQTHFRNQQFHSRYDAARCAAPETLADPEVEVYERGRRLLPAIDACITPERVYGDEVQAVCRYYKSYVQFTSEGRDPAEADRKAMQPLVEDFDRYRERVEERARRLRNIIVGIQEESPQTSMLYLLEARLYLLTGYALDHQLFLLGGRDREAAQEWFRRVIPRTQHALQSHRSYGLAYLYRAEALARLDRCDEARALVQRLHDDGYRSSSTHAVIAYCAALQDDEATLGTALEQVIDASDRENATTWASQYRKYVKERSEWKARREAAGRTEELGVVLDDGRATTSMDRVQLVTAMAPWLLEVCR